MKEIQLRFMLIVLSSLYNLMLRSSIAVAPYEEILNLEDIIKKELK